MAEKKNGAVLVVAALIYKAGKVLVVRRGPSMSGAGHWEFPGGKVETGESETQALKREIAEELNLHIRVEELLGENLHAYPAKTIHLKFYWVPMPLQEITLTEHDDQKWLKPEDIDLATLSDADKPILPAVVSGLPKRS